MPKVDLKELKIFWKYEKNVCGKMKVFKRVITINTVIETNRKCLSWESYELWYKIYTDKKEGDLKPVCVQ